MSFITKGKKSIKFKCIDKKNSHFFILCFKIALRPDFVHFEVYRVHTHRNVSALWCLAFLAVDEDVHRPLMHQSC